jgi:hypothetical protein
MSHPKRRTALASSRRSQGSLGWSEETNLVGGTGLAFPEGTTDELSGRVSDIFGSFDSVAQIGSSRECSRVRGVYPVFGLGAGVAGEGWG